MNLLKLTCGTVALVALAGASANAQIALSEHNFSSYGWSGGEICKPCHTPHFGNVDVGFLWNHALTNAAYAMHEGPGTAEANLDSRSRMCMSCHDGTVALDSFGGMTGTNFIGAQGNLGTDLENDHPIGTDAFYPPNPVPSFWATSFQPTNSTGDRVGTAPNQLRLRSFDDNGVIRYVVGCSTCHTVHNTGNFPHMVRFSNAGSALCLTCHIK